MGERWWLKLDLVVTWMLFMPTATLPEVGPAAAPTPGGVVASATIGFAFSFFFGDDDFAQTLIAAGAGTGACSAASASSPPSPPSC